MQWAFLDSLTGPAGLAIKAARSVTSAYGPKGKSGEQFYTKEAETRNGSSQIQKSKKQTIFKPEKASINVRPEARKNDFPHKPVDGLFHRQGAGHANRA